MGLLNDEYYRNLSKKSAAQTVAPAPVASMQQTPPPIIPDQSPFDKINQTVQDVGAAVTGDTFNPYKQYIEDAARRGNLNVPGMAPDRINENPLIKSEITPEEQINRFGGVVGSPEWVKYKYDNPQKSFLGKNIAASFGLHLPEEMTWDKMSRSAQVGEVVAQSGAAAVRLILELPKTVATAGARIVTSIAQPWINFLQGKDSSIEALSKEPAPEVPFIGAVPTYWQSYDEARKSGLGPAAASFVTGAQAFGDVTIVGSIAEGLVKAFTPRQKLLKVSDLREGEISTPGFSKEGEPVTIIRNDLGETVRIINKDGQMTFGEFPKDMGINVEPIKQVLAEEQTALGKRQYNIPKAESTSEYYTLPKSYASEKYGGSTNNTFVKITPAGPDSVEVAIVQRRTGAIPRTVDYVKNKLGLPQRVQQGDFGPEIKLESQIIKTGQGRQNGPQPTPVFRGGQPIDLAKGSNEGISVATTRDVAERFASRDSTGFPRKGGVVDELYLDPSAKILDPKTLTAQDIKADLFSDNIIKYARENGYDAVDFSKSLVSDPKYQGTYLPENEIRVLNSKVLKTKDQLTPDGRGIRPTPDMIEPIPPKPLKGFENKPITPQQMGNMNLIGEVNGIDAGIQEAVVRTLTGKNVVGELTQAEYVEVAKTLSTFNNINKYAPDAPGVNIFTQYGSPQRSWMRTYEQKSGIPLYSEVYVPMEDSLRLRNTFRDSYRNQAREIFGKYAQSGGGEIRRIIKNYMEGDQSVIAGLDEATKADVIRIAGEMRPLYDKLGEKFGIPTDVFLKDYQPHIADLGGVYQLYKQGSEAPKELSFFAEFKRAGSTAVQVDDALAIFDIYTNAGSNKLFLNPALERVARLSENLPETLKSSVRSYVQEKMGYAGKFEEYLNNVGTSMNKYLGTNLPPDVARQVTSLIMDTSYSGAMGLNPGTVVRNSLQYDLLAYPRLGPRFYGDALRTALTKEGMATVQKNGFLVELGVPYGEELAQDVNVFGKIGNLYRKGTQATLTPFSMADNLGRARTYWQTRYQFEDALSRYNAGKITYPQFEQALDMGAFNPVDRNIIRERLIAGDTEGAMNHMIRDVIDDTQFPYRRGSSSRITYGLTGKLGTQFGQWNIEFTHTLGKWFKNAAAGALKGDFSQFDKIVRWYGASTAMVRTFKDLGIDFQTSAYTGPLNPSLSPFVQSMIDGIDMVKAWKQDNAEEVNKNAEALTRSIKSLGRPVGVEVNNWNSFWRSYNYDPKWKTGGPNSEGLYPVLDDKHRVQYYTTFNDLWWQMLGFPTTQKVETRQFQKDVANAEFERTQAKQMALEYLQREEYDKFTELVEKYQIQIGDHDLDKYYIPLTERTYDSLPASLKAEFAPRVFK